MTENEVLRSEPDTANPSLVQLLGLCPLLVPGSSLANAAALALAACLVLVAGNVISSLVGGRLRLELRIAVFLLAITGILAAIELAMSAWWPELHDMPGMFLPLVACYCLLLARPESFAAHRSPGIALRSGVATGLGFGLLLSALGAAREFPGDVLSPALLAPAAFIVPGILLALRNRRRAERPAVPDALEPPP